MDMSPVHQVWLKPSCMAQWKGEEDMANKKRWEDNIREWTGLEFAKSQRVLENREKWRKLVVKSSLVPQRPSRLGDRWWWWWWWWCNFFSWTQHVPTSFLPSSSERRSLKASTPAKGPSSLATIKGSKQTRRLRITYNSSNLAYKKHKVDEILHHHILHILNFFFINPFQTQDQRTRQKMNAF